MKEILLSCRKLSKTFKTGSTEVPVLKNIDLDIYKGDFTVLMGSSGAGKSTLLYMLSGMEYPSEGSVTYSGEEISSYTDQKLSALRAQSFGFVFQQTHLIGNLSLLENVLVRAYLDKNRTEKEARYKAQELLVRMKIGELADRLPNQVSGGEAQRAALARAVVNNPGIIFADEPTGALNRNNTNEVLELLVELHKAGQSLLMVTHDLRAAVRGTRILYVEDGCILNEISLPSYTQEKEKEREVTLSQWLANFSW